MNLAGEMSIVTDSLAQRLERVEGSLSERGFDQLLVTDPVSVRWVAGLARARAACVVGPGERLVVVERFVPADVRAALSDAGFEVVDAQLPSVEAAKRSRGRVAFEDDRVTVRDHARLDALDGERELVAAGALLADLRAVKDEAELEALRAAARLSDAVLEWLAAQALADRTERELVEAVEGHMRELGSEEPAFDPLIVSGPRAAEPHGDPADVPIEPDAVVIVDLGCVVDGYRSDCTRVFAPGGVDGEAAEVYAAVTAAQEAAVAALEPGAATREVDAAARAVLDEAGYGEGFVHGVGHGVGLEIHEAPMLLRASEGAVAEGNVVTIEPAVYLPGRFGVRLEDTVWVGPDGPERLTNFARELVVT